MPGASAGVCPANVPAALQPYCSTITRARQRGTTSGSTSSFTNQPYTTIIIPDFSFGSETTDYPVNYLWWMINEIYNGRAPEFFPQDRMSAAKEAITALVNQLTVDGQDPKLKFGLARYNSDNGGSVYVRAALNNKAQILAAINDANDANSLPAELTAGGLTPLSETLVDVARYLAGDSLFGTYPV